jgi:hypothetical protein
MLKVRVELGGNVFESEGDFGFDDGFLNALVAWFNAQQAEVPAQLQALTARLRRAKEAAHASVVANTPRG